MQGRELFGAALRVLGVWFLYMAGNALLNLLLRTGTLISSTANQMTVDKFYVAYYLLLAIFLIRLADPITRAVYGPADKGA